MSPRLSSEPKILVRCPKCGGRRYVAQTYARRITTGQYHGLCDHCRYPARIEITDRHRRYWTSRYTNAEIIELAAGLETLLADHSRYARGPTGRKWDEAA